MKKSAYISYCLGSRDHYAEHHFADDTWLQLHKSEIRLVSTDGKLLTTLQFRSRAAAAEAWPILCALPSAAARIAQGVC